MMINRERDKFIIRYDFSKTSNCIFIFIEDFRNNCNCGTFIHPHICIVFIQLDPSLFVTRIFFGCVFSTWRQYGRSVNILPQYGHFLVASGIFITKYFF